jgi:hypothetical protein
MDFPVCPACGESVIDDDAEDCPFCGAPMKAKPGSKPAAKPAAAKPTAAKPTPASAGKAGSSASMSTTGKSGTATKSAAAKGGASSPGDDFPFEAELPGAKTAIQAMPSPSKGRTHQVVCPMCETAGYVPPTAVGKEVKCANPKCMVPVFKAPAPTVEAPPPAPPKKSNLMLVGGITVAVMVIAGGAMIFLSSQAVGPKGPKVLSDADRELMREMASNKAPVENEVKNRNKPVLDVALPDDKTKTTDATPKTSEDFIAAAIKQLDGACLIGDRRQRSKPYCRQLAADASVLTGDIKAANEHLSQLVIVGRTVPYYRIEPNLEKFWRAWSAGDKAAAKTALDAAVADAPKLQTVGRNQMEVASRLAAALATADRVGEGLEILERHQSDALEGQLAARVQMASDGRIARLSKSAAVLPWTKPQAAATTGSLVNHGQLAAGLTWAQKQPDEETRVECLAIWAEGFAQNAKVAGAMPEIDEAVKTLSPALAARVWARAACGRFAAGDQDGASSILKTAQNLIASVPVPKEPEMPNTKAAISYKQPAATPLVQAATAAAEIAYAHSLMPSHLTQAEEALELSLTFARGLAPALPAVTTKLDQAEQAGLAGLREKMKQELSLKSDDQASQNVSKYRKVLADMGEASQRRHQLQLNIMSRLAEVGLKNKVWSVVSNRSAESNASRRDDFLGTPLIGILLEVFQGSETEKSIQGALGGANPVWPEGAYVRQFLQQQDYAGAALYVSKLDSNSGLRDEVALMFATNLAAADKADAALGFISKLEDIVLREEAYRLSAALLTQRQRSDVIWKQVLALPQATEKASLCLGLVVGLKAGPQPKELPEPSLVP